MNVFFLCNIVNGVLFVFSCVRTLMRVARRGVSGILLEYLSGGCRDGVLLSRRCKASFLMASVVNV